MEKQSMNIKMWILLCTIITLIISSTEAAPLSYRDTIIIYVVDVVIAIVCGLTLLCLCYFKCCRDYPD